MIIRNIYKFLKLALMFLPPNMTEFICSSAS